jgi:hypothetical protein
MEFAIAAQLDSNENARVSETARGTQGGAGTLRDVSNRSIS